MTSFYDEVSCFRAYAETKNNGGERKVCMKWIHFFRSSDAKVSGFIIQRFSCCCHLLVDKLDFSVFLISFFILLYSLRTLFTKTNSSWLIFESIIALEINTSILFNFDFANNTTYHASFPFFNYWLMLLYILIPTVIPQIFNPIAAPVIHIRIPIKKRNQKLKYIQ